MVSASKVKKKRGIREIWELPDFVAAICFHIEIHGSSRCRGTHTIQPNCTSCRVISPQATTFSYLTTPQRVICNVHVRDLVPVDMLTFADSLKSQPFLACACTIQINAACSMSEFLLQHPTWSDSLNGPKQKPRRPEEQNPCHLRISGGKGRRPLDLPCHSYGRCVCTENGIPSGRYSYNYAPILLCAR